MNRGRRAAGLVIALLCCTAAAAGLFYRAGYRAAEARLSAQIPQTFYAVISDVEDGWFTVTGMEVNDINYRGRFCFSVDEETVILWRYTDLPVEELEAGDHIAVTFSGEVLESSPAILRQVVMLQLLDDEK